MATAALDAPASQRHRAPAWSHMPGLDGVRAIAVLGVLVFHANPTWLPGGFLGVDVFFGLSGFLITSLLLAELDASGRLRFGRFYLRRARRLLPALFVVLIATSILAVTVAQDAAARVKEDVVASTFYVTNWWYVVHGTSYFEATGRPPLLQHLWSLSVEEQFYLIWPLLMFGLWKIGRTRGVRYGALGGAIVSTILMTWVSVAQGMPTFADTSRIYFGTDTHSMTLLVGAVLATLWRPGTVIARLTPRGRIATAWLGAASLVLLLLVFWFVGPMSVALYRGGFLVVGLITAGVVAAAAVSGTVFSRALAMQPWRWIGERSYGIYLWHWPIFMVLRPGIDLDAEGWPVQVLRFALTFAAAELSYRFVEMPIRHGALGRAWARWRETGRQGHALRAGIAGVSVAAVVLALGVGLSSAKQPTLADELGGITSVGDTITPSPSASGGRAKPSTSSSSSAKPSKSATPPAAPPVLPPTADATKLPIMAVGDSVMLAANSGLKKQFPGILVDAHVSRSPADIFLRIKQRAAADGLRPVVVIGAGTNGPIQSADLTAILTFLKDRSVVVLVTCRADRAWIAQSNAAIAAAYQQFGPGKGNVRIADWQSFSDGHRDWFYSDGIHPKPPTGPAQYAALVEQTLKGSS
jgi:peptidoglycan/LPS O-acetylase OafA/YrhL